MRKTKIICTLGPSTDSPEILEAMMKSGMDVARFNFSHGDYEEHMGRFKILESVREELGLPIAALLDTKGPEIRTGSLKDGKKVTLKEGDVYTLTTEETVGDHTRGFINYAGLPADVKPGNQILIDDGLIELDVEEVKGNDIVCRVKNGGELGEKKGVNVPNVKINLPALTDKDKEDILFGIQAGFDYIAASFVRNAGAIREIKEILEKHGSRMLVIAKIENAEGIENLDSILENYGVKRSSGIVVETDSQHYYPQMPYYLLPNIQSDDITTEVKSNYILMPVAQAIQKLDSYRDTITIKSLLTTTEDAYIENDPENSTWSKSADSETGAFDLGVSITETVDDKETQIIYFSSASMLSSQIDQAISGANSKLAATALTSMCDVEQTVVIPSKSTSYTNLVFTQGAVNTWSIITIAGIPLVLVVIGVMIWMKRRKQ